jgi:exopolysaccharide biosynthesis WecB/TagA/CpsF family protein
LEALLTTRDILGLHVAVLDEHDALTIVENALIKKQPLRLAFVNANLANMAKSTPTLYETLQSFMLFNDGSGMNIASKLLYRKPFPANLNGTDFVPYFLANCNIKLRIFLLGASPAVVEATGKFFEKKWPQHQIVGIQHGFFTAAENTSVQEQIKSVSPDLVLVAMGNGLQEMWIQKLVPDATISAWGVGALFDFLCEQAPRAPNWMRHLGIEWIFRLYLEPNRLWRRYLIGNFVFVFSVIKQYLTSNKHSH